MRMYQHIGLTKEAYKFLEGTVRRIPDIICPKCKHIVSTKMDSTVYDEPDLFYGDGPTLRAYRLINGTIITEVVQASPWSSGPMGFICLENETGDKLFKWTDKQIMKQG